MSAVITYNHHSAALAQQFPDFADDIADIETLGTDNASLYFSYFSIYLKEQWNNPGIHRRLAPLLQQMHTTADEATQILLNDFLLDVCSSAREHSLDLNLLLQELTPELQQRLLQANAHWMAAACQLPGGCC